MAIITFIFVILSFTVVEDWLMISQLTVLIFRPDKVGIVNN